MKNKPPKSYRRCRFQKVLHTVDAEFAAPTKLFEPLEPVTMFLTKKPPGLLTFILIWQMDLCAVRSWSLQPLSVKSPLGRANTNWGAAVIHGGFCVRKLPVRQLGDGSSVTRGLGGGGSMVKNTSKTEPIRPVASLIHPQRFVLPPLSLWISLIDMTKHWQRTGLTSGLNSWPMCGPVKRGDVAVYSLCHVDPEFAGLRNAVLRRYSLTLGFQEGIIQLVLIRLQS